MKVTYLLISFLFLHVGRILAQDINLALEATPSTSFVSAWENLNAINDNSTHASSFDKGTGAYGNWPNGNSWQWVQYTWDKYVSLSEIEVYWWTDGAGIQLPSEAYLEYADNAGEWIRLGDFAKQSDQWNEFAIAPNQTTTKLRLWMKHDSESTGILEWRTWGQYIVDNEPPTNPESLQLTATGKSHVTLNWSYMISMGEWFTRKAT
jgi:hypothetical protein